jgi:diguanylate cyclase (GGDEF)-like protein
MNLPLARNNNKELDCPSSQTGSSAMKNLSARLIQEVSKDDSLEPMLRQLLAHAIEAASDAERRVAERDSEIERLRKLSVTDEATGLLNRRGFSDSLTRALTRAERYGETGLLIIIDLDGFKDINDTHGHAAGDFVLKVVSDVLRQCVRQVDDIARIGGDEFAVLVNQTTPKPALDRANMISTVLNDLIAPWRHRSIKVRASIGTEPYGPGADPSDLFNQADSDMYANKQRARLRVIT